MKHRPQLGLFCPACNPVTRALRRRAVRRIHDNAHIVWADTLAQNVRRERLRAVLGDFGEPWQISLATTVLETARAHRDIITVMPPQHPQNATPRPGRDL